MVIDGNTKIERCKESEVDNKKEDAGRQSHYVTGVHSYFWGRSSSRNQHSRAALAWAVWGGQNASRGVRVI